MDKDLLPKTLQSKICADAGKYAQIVSFYGAHCIIRKADGADLAMVTESKRNLQSSQRDPNQWRV